MDKLFVITRSDMPEAYQAVQSGHAVAQWMLDNPNHHWRNQTLVYLKTKDLPHLEMLSQRLTSRCFDHSVFVEPDLNDEKTSIAVFGADKILSGLKLMGV